MQKVPTRGREVLCPYCGDVHDRREVRRCRRKRRDEFW
jgi:hypothetical protein